ncbi:MAG: hypothetical protein JWQ88_55, partial [Rhodoferax sp.]|nr:hypothetical protein [Rhodoferax sp.]
MRAAWVIGSGGMVGRALTAALAADPRATLFHRSFDWTRPDLLRHQFTDAVSAFAGMAAGFPQWEIFWTAGTGTFASSAEAMAQETDCLRMLLSALQDHPALRDAPGCLALASSAGAIYAGS